ncbi:RHS repeat-associated core domain-containing protein [Stenotrophomonas panacihumi]|uniref:RHS repeat-associated core domain-containing protein n=1 Tax=Stenotrophomonas panacihumi TaxID=676599 RepID=UPI000A7ED530|nr:RHS repeat-associated core domain-containing protein [Stenotrophomonas panacihumi]PTN55677.1 hypothetical protein C9J98_03600 [Stenotrophomonas panacihumi]
MSRWARGRNTITNVMWAGLVWFGFATGASAQMTTVEYIHTDALGSPTVATNASGVVVERQAYEPYGAPISHGPTDGPGFAGHVEDSATGLTYMQQRYYDPMVGRFLSNDPVTVDATNGWNLNRFGYGANNPYKFKDPDGRIIDTVVDIGFLAYDVYSIATEGATPTNMAALGADALATVIPGVTGAGLAVRAAEHGAEAAVHVAEGAAHATETANAAAKAEGKLPKPPTGPGSVAKSERDPKRYFSSSEREAKRAEQGGQCANGCGTQIDASNSAGHHIDRHADGGPSVPENHAEVCIECHKELHSGG